MACKDCKDPKISDEYKCDACHVKAGSFKWCVITKAREMYEGNQFDDTITFDYLVEIYDGVKFIKLPKINPSKGYINFKNAVFQQGEIFPIGPDFEREMVGNGRKAGKWDVEYKVFNSTQYKQAVASAIEATKEYRDSYFVEQDNLKYLEEKYTAKQRLAYVHNELSTSKDPLKTLFEFVRQRIVSVEEADHLSDVI